VKQLLITSKAGLGKAQHYHVVYINDETGTVYCSRSAGHEHEIGQTEGREPVTDPDSGELIDEGEEPGWVVYPSEDGHFHEELLDYPEPASRKKRESESSVVAEVVSLYREAVKLEDACVKRGKEADKYYIGEHWDEREKQRLANECRAALTFNKIGKHVNELSGIQRDERSDIAYTPIEGGDQVTADLLNVVTKVELSRCNFTMEESAVFLDQIIPGRGVIVPRIDYEESLTGKLVIERFPWQNVKFGPHDKVDGSDAEYVFLEKQYSKAKLQQIYPDKADDIQADFTYYHGEPDKHVEHEGDMYKESTQRTPVLVGENRLVDVALKEYLVLECRRKLYSKVPIIVNHVEDFILNADGWKPKDLEAVKALSEDFFVINKTVTKIRITKIAGNVLLTDENPAKLPVDDLLVIPVYGNFRDGKWWGLVEGAKDPQKLINKLLSLSADIVNKMAAYGYFYDDNTFPDETVDKEMFKSEVNSPGFLIKVQDASKPPTKSEGTKFPEELVQLVEYAAGLLEELLGIQVDSAGANESAAHLMHRQDMRLRGARHIFDHLSLAKKKIGKLLIPIIKMYRRPADIYRIVANQHEQQADGVELGGQAFDTFSEEEIMRLFEQADIENYDVEATENPWSPTARIAISLLLQELIKAGAQIPPETPLYVADIPDKLRKQVLESLASAQAAQTEVAKETSNMEIGKTLAAKGIITPKIAEEQGIPHLAERPPGDSGAPQPEQFQGDEYPLEGGLAE
jgi:hypothetical protein